jgi:hypothetical protein
VTIDREATTSADKIDFATPLTKDEVRYVRRLVHRLLDIRKTPPSYEPHWRPSLTPERQARLHALARTFVETDVRWAARRDAGER